MVVKTWSGNVRNKSPFIVSIEGVKLFGEWSDEKWNECPQNIDLAPSKIEMIMLIDVLVRRLHVEDRR